MVLRQYFGRHLAAERKRLPQTDQRYFNSISEALGNKPVAQQKTGVTPPGRLWYSDSTLGDTWQQKETRLPRQTEVHSKYIKGLVTVKHKKTSPDGPEVL